MGNPRTFHYLNQSNCYELDGVDDSKEYVITRSAMDVVGINHDEQVPFSGGCLQTEYEDLCLILLFRLKCNFFNNFQEAIFRVVAAILHLGNIEFVKGKEMDSSEPKDDKSWFHLRTAAELFMYYFFNSAYPFLGI